MAEAATRTGNGPAIPTEEAPETGAVAIGIGGNSIPISEVEHWVEDGMHVFRSVEFDCFAQDETEWSAVAKFIANAEDLFRFLDDVMDAGRATQHETEVLVKLSRRFFEVAEAIEEEEKRRSLIRLRRNLSTPSWLPLQPSNSSELARA